MKRRILVIEDNVDCADSLREALELEGDEVAVAYTGREGIATARSFRPDVVFCDLGLPELDGFDVARAMRTDALLRSAFIIAISGYPLDEDIDRSEQAGFDGHITKPVDISTLERLIHEGVPDGRTRSTVGRLGRGVVLHARAVSGPRPLEMQPNQRPRGTVDGPR